VYSAAQCSTSSSHFISLFKGKSIIIDIEYSILKITIKK
jgi:hypothetical protein